MQLSQITHNQASFVQGGKAIVEAQSQNADVSEMTVKYGSGTYQMDSSGSVAVPLADTGQQQMTLSYQGVSKQVAFEVEPRSEGGQDNGQTDGQSGDQADSEQSGQNQQGSDDSESLVEVNAPGFTSVMAVIAILFIALLARIRR